MEGRHHATSPVSREALDGDEARDRMSSSVFFVFSRSCCSGQGQAASVAQMKLSLLRCSLGCQDLPLRADLFSSESDSTNVACVINLYSGDMRTLPACPSLAHLLHFPFFRSNSGVKKFVRFHSLYVRWECVLLKWTPVRLDRKVPSWRVSQRSSCESHHTQTFGAHTATGSLSNQQRCEWTFCNWRTPQRTQYGLS